MDLRLEYLETEQIEQLNRARRLCLARPLHAGGPHHCDLRMIGGKALLPLEPPDVVANLGVGSEIFRYLSTLRFYMIASPA